MRRPFIYLIVAVLTFAAGVTASIFLRGVLTPTVEERSTSVVLTTKASVQPVIIEQRQGAFVPQGTIRGGILNDKAISLPVPAYPAIARAAHASGTVIVQIVIDEDGNVVSAEAVGGHPLLQEAAVEAARQARFTPTRLSGQPIKVTGILTYNFVVQ
jgi:TonB family protein